MKKRLEKIMLLAITAISLAVIHLYVIFYTPASRDGGAKVVYIPKGASFRVIAVSLERAGVIRDSESFIFAARLLGAYKKVMAGEYELDRSMAPIEVLDSLVKGRVKKYYVTIPEGYNLKEAATALKEAGLADPDQFMEKATDERFAATLGLPGRTLEGYLYPDTYELIKGMEPEEIMQMMVEKFKSVYYSEFYEAAKKRGMSMDKVVTLASIIEKETGSAGERELISAVFHNRLKKGIKLQSDPTVVYAIKDFNGNITKKDLLTKTPYNTYVYHGLPPGPIANPGRAALKAAINPADEDYLFFVSRNDGTHYFSRSLKEHNRAVNIYQRNIKPVATGSAMSKG